MGIELAYCAEGELDMTLLYKGAEVGGSGELAPLTMFKGEEGRFVLETKSEFDRSLSADEVLMGGEGRR
jgi:hypothetical protein